MAEGVLERAWDETAGGYDAYFSPRFAPWGRAATAEVLSLEPGEGHLMALCCGPGRSLAQLAEGAPGRRLVGVDLSAGMLERARARLGGRAELIQRDAAQLDDLAGAAGIVSCFGLQQMPDPPAALAAWGRALRPGGVLSVVLWQSPVEQEGPFALARRLIDAQLEASGDVRRRSAEWAGALAAALESAGVEILKDARPAHEMRYASPESFWAEMTRAGPWRAMSIRQGPAWMASLERSFMAACPPGALSHRPSARWLVGRRPG